MYLFFIFFLLQWFSRLSSKTKRPQNGLKINYTTDAALRSGLIEQDRTVLFLGTGGIITDIRKCDVQLVATNDTWLILRTEVQSCSLVEPSRYISTVILLAFSYCVTILWQLLI